MSLLLYKFKRRAFTLVELLVVIAIVAILAVISIGPIGNMILAGKTAKCNAHMHQIGIGFQGYLTDHNNVMPQRIYGDDTPYFTVLAPYTGGINTNKATSIFVCPSHPECSFPDEPSYGMNWYYDNCSVLTVPGMGTTIMVAETLGVAGEGSNRADKDSMTPGELAPTRHAGSANYVFFDGHSERLQYAATTNFWGVNMGNHSVQTPPP